MGVVMELMKFDKDAMVGTTRLAGYVYNLGSEIDKLKVAMDGIYSQVLILCD